MVSANLDIVKHRDAAFGEIPIDWAVESLSSNSSLKARIGWQGLTTSEYLTNGEYYLITGTDFDNGRINWTGCHFVSKFRFDQDKNIQVKKDDILVTKDGTIGKVAIIDEFFNKATLNSGVFVIRPLRNAYHPKYMFYVLMSKYFRDFLDKLAAGSTISHLYQKDFVNFNFLLPTLNEQKQIANVLSETDKLIGSIEKLIDKKKNIKQGTMQQLLTGEKRLYGFSKDYKEFSLKDLVELNKGQQINRSTLSETEKYPVINGGIEPSGYTYGWNTETETITISEGGNSCGYVNFFKTRFWAGGHVYCLRLIKDNDKLYLYYMLKLLEPKIMSLRVGSGLPNIQKKELYDYTLNITTDLDEQKAIAQILSHMDKDIEALEKKLNKYKQIKQGMMQELLTGRIRLV
jgi:type I restriction enzyme S subunit